MKATLNSTSQVCSIPSVQLNRGDADTVTQLHQIHMAGGEEQRTRQHLLHVDLALLEEVGQPLAVFQLGRLLQAEQEEGEVCAVLQWVRQLRHADQLRHDRPRRKLRQVRLHQGDVHLDLSTLLQNVEESLQIQLQEEKKKTIKCFIF